MPSCPGIHLKIDMSTDLSERMIFADTLIEIQAGAEKLFLLVLPATHHGGISSLIYCFMSVMYHFSELDSMVIWATAR